MRYATLCSGIEGFGLGFDRAGMECVLQSENDKHCLQVLNRHYPDVEKTTDVNDAETELSLRRLRPDLIAFGSPCQDLSVAGRCAGLSGERSGLFFRCMELCFAAEASYVVWENVLGVFSSNGGADFASVLEAFTGYRPSVPSRGWRNTGVCIGLLYSVAWAVLDSQWCGVPQRRRRVFVVGCLNRRADPYKILSLAESVPWDSPPSREAGQSVAAGLTSGTAASRGVNPPGRRREDDVNLVCTPLLEVGARTNSDGNRDGDGIGDVGDVMYTLQAGKQHGVHVAATLNSGGNNGGFRTEPGEHLVSYCLNGKQGNRVDGEIETFVVAFAENQRGELRQSDIAPQLSCQGGKPGSGYAAVQVGTAVRRLLPVECERLQGFPDNWTAIGDDGATISDSARYRMIGNAITVPVAQWIGRRLMEVDNHR